MRNEEPSIHRYESEEWARHALKSYRAAELLAARVHWQTQPDN